MRHHGQALLTRVALCPPWPPKSWQPDIAITHLTEVGIGSFRIPADLSQHLAGVRKPKGPADAAAKPSAAKARLQGAAVAAVAA